MIKFHLLGKYTPENKAIAPIGAKLTLCGKSLNNIPKITSNIGNNLKSLSLFISSIISFVARHGFEPQFLRSERSVLPLDYRAIWHILPLNCAKIMLHMKTINELASDLKLTPEQAAEIEKYIGELVVELLESIKRDNDKNFDETIESLKN